MKALKQIALGTVLLAVLTASACGGNEESDTGNSGPDDWAYSGVGGAESWGSISEEWETCASGTKQSPIDISGPQPGDAPPLSFSFRRDAQEITNDGRNLNIEYGSGNRLGLSERTYQLVSASLHAPSEHSIEGQEFSLELQLRHDQTFGDVAIVAFLYSIGEADPVIQNIIDAAPVKGETKAVGFTINAADYIPSDFGYYKYEGSLTVPPCDEPVDWFIMLETKTVSQEQVDQIQALFDAPNNRPLQNINGRQIIASGPRPQ